MIKIIVGSENPVKISAVYFGFKKFFEEFDVLSRKADSGVAQQPFENDTFTGAENRAESLRKLNHSENLEADYFVGIEGGISRIFERWFAFGCICIKNRSGRTAFGTSPHFELPESMIEKIRNGKELGEVIDDISNSENTKRKEGAIGYFTNGVMNREELYKCGVITALIPFINSKLYFDGV
jgi:inosine/xanthosine triphosphatase